MIYPRRIVGLACLAGVGAGAAQLPAFVQQYLQRLGGHLDEARFLAAQLGDSAIYSELTPAARAAVATATDARIAELSAAHDAILNASGPMRPIVLLTHIDNAIAVATWRVFEPGLPLGWGGALYGAGAAAVVFLAYAGCRRLLRRRRRSPDEATLVEN
ncbi:MAG: DUF2937 family protein [Alphaproteobacteria bacterium]|nr:DUF2937 family protein [Alphaproteobacteria bacterium]